MGETLRAVGRKQGLDVAFIDAQQGRVRRHGLEAVEMRGRIVDELDHMRGLYNIADEAAGVVANVAQDVEGKDEANGPLSGVSLQRGIEIRPATRAGV